MTPQPSLSADAGGDLIVPAYIDGVFTELSGTFDVISPYSNSRAWRAASASPSDAIRAADAASRAFSAWADTKPVYRRDILLKAAQLIEERFDDIATVMRTEMGADVLSSHKVILPIAIEMIKDVAARISSIQGWFPTVEKEGQSAVVTQVPVGVTVGFCAWNAPFAFAARSIATALAAGCTTIIKGSEKTPRCYQVVAQCFHDAGLPKGVLNMIYCPPAEAAAVSAALVEHEAVRKVNFTGSSLIGRKIAVLCAQNLKPCLMELGGKNSALVLKDADLELAAAEVAIGAFVNSGQICMSTDRVIVAREIVDDFKRALTKAIGDMSGNRELPPTLVSAAAKERLEAALADARERGAEILTGEWSDESSSAASNGKGGGGVVAAAVTAVAAAAAAAATPNGGRAATPDRKTGVFFRPVVVDGALPAMTVWQEENFGSVLAIAAADDEAEMVRMANSTGYGLSASIFTPDLRRALRLARRIETGAVHVNSMTVHDEPALPFGGVKDSGWGRFNGVRGLDEFLVTKAVTWMD